VTEFAIFNDEGQLEGGFFERARAEAASARYRDDPHVFVDEICPDHPDQPRSACEECNREDDDDDDTADHPDL
jgi:hypothetical protein